MHVKRLYEMRKTLHELYEGQQVRGGLRFDPTRSDYCSPPEVFARPRPATRSPPCSLLTTQGSYDRIVAPQLIGATDDAVAVHEGELSKEAVERASKGVVRRLVCPNNGGAGKVAPAAREALGAMLKAAPCTLLELNLTAAPGLDGVELGDGLLLPTGGGQLACYRLRTLKLARTKLGGEIPKALQRCVWLQTLELQDNWLRGKIPDTLGKCTMLETLALHGNTLDGEVPAAALAQLVLLTTLTLGGEVGGNEDLYVTRVGAEAITRALPDATVYLPKEIDRQGEGDAEAAAALAKASAGKEAEEAAAAASVAEEAKRAATREATARKKAAAKEADAEARAARERREAKRAAEEREAAEKAAAERAAAEKAAAEQEEFNRKRDGVLEQAKEARAEEQRKLQQALEAQRRRAAGTTAARASSGAATDRPMGAGAASGGMVMRPGWSIAAMTQEVPAPPPPAPLWGDDSGAPSATQLSRRSSTGRKSVLARWPPANAPGEEPPAPSSRRSFRKWTPPEASDGKPAGEESYREWQQEGRPSEGKLRL